MNLCKNNKTCVLRSSLKSSLKPIKKHCKNLPSIQQSCEFLMTNKDKKKVNYQALSQHIHHRQASGHHRDLKPAVGSQWLTSMPEYRCMPSQNCECESVLRSNRCLLWSKASTRLLNSKFQIYLSKCS